MLCKNTFCGAKVRPFYEVAKNFSKKLHNASLEQHVSTMRAHLCPPQQSPMTSHCHQRGTNERLRHNHDTASIPYIQYIQVYFTLKRDYRLGFSFVQSSTAGMMPRAIISSRILPKCSTEDCSAAISSAVP